MNKKILIIVGSVILVVGVGFYYFIIRRLPFSDSQTLSFDTSIITISNFSFKPAEITIKAGMKVVWKNNDLAGHLITADDGSFLSSVISQGQTFEHTFSAAGTFPYHCKIHPSMTGKVIVE